MQVKDLLQVVYYNILMPLQWTEISMGIYIVLNSTELRKKMIDIE